MKTRGKLLLYRKTFEEGIFRNEISKILSYLSKMNNNTTKWNGNVLNETCAREITSALIITNEKKYRIRLGEEDLYRRLGFWGGIGIHRCDFCRRFRFRLFGEKKACKSMLVSGYTVAGDNKLSMKCFEINIFFFFFRLSFPL